MNEFVIGVDGGGTHTRVAFAAPDGRELGRAEGPPGIIEPANPAAAAERIIGLVRRAAKGAGLELPGLALCAGLAGAGAATLRETTRAALATASLARPELTAVVEDGEIAVEGALGGEPGLLVAAGTGSVAWGRAEDGRVERCGGWGRVVGDEGSAYALVRDAFRAALRALDGRGPETRLLPDLLAAVDAPEARAVPAWLLGVEKADVAALAPLVLEAAESGDEVARRLVDEAARELALHVEALMERLGPWSGRVPLVLHGGLVAGERFAARVLERLEGTAVERRAAHADPVTGALRRALEMAFEPG